MPIRFVVNLVQLGKVLRTEEKIPHQIILPNEHRATSVKFVPDNAAHLSRLHTELITELRNDDRVRLELGKNFVKASLTDKYLKQLNKQKRRH